jgi:nucleotide-binding universal stress UspA family protein
MKILIGIDESDFSRAAVEQIARRQWASGTQVKLVSAIEETGPYQLNPDDPNPYELARIAMDRAAAILGESKNRFEVSTDIIEGSPKQVLLDEAEGWGADLIVVGSHGRRGLERFLLGSVSQAVALHAKCSVEIVRAPRVRAA